MKAAKRRRDPSKEPFASPFSDEERQALDGDAKFAELMRATGKVVAAKECELSRNTEQV